MRRAGVLATFLCALALQASPAGAIVGGQPAAPGTFTYVADIFIGGAFGCTGTLVAPQWVVTAGHCGSVTGGVGVPTPVAWPAPFYDVELGSVHADGTGAEKHSVTQVVVDSDYIVTNGAGNDVTLLKLDKPSAIAPMQIAATADKPSWAPGVLATIAGFGLTSENGSAPAQMQYAKVPITTDQYCANAYPNGLSATAGSFDAKTMICAGYPQGGTDTCQGDSGGPLLVPVPGGALRLVGATSFGDGCARPGKPGVYARLAEGPIRGFIQSFVPEAFAPAGSSVAAQRVSDPAAAAPALTTKPAATAKKKHAKKHHKAKHRRKKHAKKRATHR
jgi:secreted trypsin-like serine protease